MGHRKSPRVNKLYSESAVQEALKDIKFRGISINKAAKVHKVNRTALQKRLKGERCGNVGRCPVLRPEEEAELAKTLQIAATWGFPLNADDLKHLTKSYLDRAGRTERRFVNNLPGKDWVNNFLKRQKDTLTTRLCNNIKRARAEVSEETLREYYSELKVSLSGIEPENIFNYDESNLSDDPGKVRLIFRRGVKYPDRVITHSKSTTTIMMCVSATGVILPPYVVYKATCLWNSWCEGGPKGAPLCTNNCCSHGTRFSRTPHGWFDAVTFVDWFQSCFLPHAKKLPGPKAIIGDNLSSHFSIEVLEDCEAHNIKFICLPPNATHLCQPLDVAVFGPIKKKWRAILTDYKAKNKKNTLVTKERFPSLLSELITSCAPSLSKNIINGFASCGIYPLNVNCLLKKLPSTQVESIDTQDISEALLLFLKEQRTGLNTDTSNAGPSGTATIASTSAAVTKKRKRKLDVPPGKSITRNDIPQLENQPSKRVTTSKVKISQKRKTCDKRNGKSTIQPRKQFGKHQNAGNLLFGFSSDEDDTDSLGTGHQAMEDMEAVNNAGELKSGMFVLAQFQGGKRMKSSYKYVCIIQNRDDNEICALTMRCQDENKTVFIASEEIVNFDLEDVMYKLPNPDIKVEGTRMKYVFKNSVSDVFEAA